MSQDVYSIACLFRVCGQGRRDMILRSHCALEQNQDREGIDARAASELLRWQSEYLCYSCTSKAGPLVGDSCRAVRGSPSLTVEKYGERFRTLCRVLQADKNAELDCVHLC